MSAEITGSMIDHWLRCQRLYHYHHDRGLQPRELPHPIQVGRAGHVVLEAYYRARLNGDSHADAVTAANGEAAWRADVLGQDSPAFRQGVELAGYYLAAKGDEGGRWEWISVEQEVRQERAGWTLVATIDLVARDRQLGDLVVWDHRFLWEPYSQRVAKRDQQLPRYAGVASRTWSEPVSRGIRNMVSTKPLARLAKANHGRTRRWDIPFTQRRLEIVNAEMEATAQQILAWRQLPMESRALLARRTVIAGETYGTCAQCPLVALCDAEAWGEDTTALLELEYEPSDYYVSGV